jgi:hypothetical protein
MEEWGEKGMHQERFVEKRAVEAGCASFRRRWLEMEFEMHKANIGPAMRTICC